MTSFTTFYLSRIIGNKVFDSSGNAIGIILDLLIFSMPNGQGDPSAQQLVRGIKLRINREIKFFSFQHFNVIKTGKIINVTCNELVELPAENVNNGLLLVENILDKQIVDLNGRKLVRANDVRMVKLTQGIFAIAVDIGIAGLLRRIGIEDPLKNILTLFRINIPAKYILWDDVQAIDFANFNIKLSKSYSKLHTLHPSDLADIIEDLGKKTSMTIFSSLDEEKAADVLEELEMQTQIHIVENLPVNKAADVLEKMPADEAADIIDELEDDKAELLLNEMEAESSQEVRELLEYPDNSVGSLMTTDILSFSGSLTVEEVINIIRIRKPEAVELYNIFVTEKEDELAGTFGLRDLIIAQPDTTINKIMKEEPVFLFDDQKVDAIAEIISKYNLLAIPVVDKKNQLQGMVVIDDVVEDLINERRTKKRK
jgi:CBS domain-containing protein/sporulation protein YlmC with PRC-barrel domain